MEKNVRVLDENGNDYGFTWPKRAQGLVKKGRARFASDNAIVLRAPPNEKEHLEEQNMSKHNITVDPSAVEYSIPYILHQIALIQAETSYLNDTLDKLSAMSDGDNGVMGGAGNILGQAKAQALGDIVRCRETTNQQILRIYEKMYDDLVGRSRNDPANPAGI